MIDKLIKTIWRELNYEIVSAFKFATTEKLALAVAYLRLKTSGEQCMQYVFD